MNNKRRKQISDIITSLENVKSEIENVLSDEQEYLDNIPENLQGSERYEIAESAVNNLESASDSVDEVLSALQESQA